jgi:FimV-like protein
VGAATHVEDIFDELMGTPNLPPDETLEFGTSDTGHIEPIHREADIGTDTNTELKLEFELAEFDPQKKTPRTATGPGPASPNPKPPDPGRDTQKQFDESLAALSEHTSTTFIPDVGGETMVNTKLDLAKAYLEMGDKDSARSILDEVLEEGSAGQKAQAQDLIRSLGT